MAKKAKKLLKRIYLSMLRARERQAAEFLLSRMSKRELDDIGINRSDIPKILKGYK